MRRRTHRHVAGHHCDLGLEVDAELLPRHDDVVARAEEIVAAALVHQGVGVEALGHLGAARLAHQLDVVDERRAVGPLVGARQRRHALLRIEGECVARLALVQRLREVFELR